MNTFDQQVVHLFSTRQSELSDRSVMDFFRSKHASRCSYDFGGFSGCIRDVNTHFSALADSIAADDPGLFVDYARWVSLSQSARNVPTEYLATILQVMGRSIGQALPEEIAERASRFIEAAITEIWNAGELQEFIREDNPQHGPAREYLGLLLKADYNSAETLILDAFRRGLSLEDIYLQVLQPSQRELGRLWQMNRISVAKEHYCTACTRSVMGRLMENVPPATTNSRRMIATCVIGEQHDLGLVMICDFLRMRGWVTNVISSNLPPEGIVETLCGPKPMLLAVSVTMLWNLRWANAIIELVRSSDQCRDVPIMIGGYPFLVSPDLWQKLDADGSALDARAAAGLAETLASQVAV